MTCGTPYISFCRFSKCPGEVRVPSVRVHDLAAPCDGFGHQQIDRERAQRRDSGASPSTVCSHDLIVAGYLGGVGDRRFAKTVHARGPPAARQLARQVFDVHACAAVNLRRIFTAQAGLFSRIFSSALFQK